MDVLPTEICIRVLSELPITFDGANVLARCSMTGKGTLRAASLDPHLWKPHYEHHYVRSDHGKELERRARLKEDWRQLYGERRRLDRVALENLRVLEICPPEARVDYARQLVVLGLDIWDVLSMEAHRPPPTLFHDEEDIAKVMGGSPLTNLSRKYWASEIRRLIARRHAIDRWTNLKYFISGDLDNVPVSFEEAFASLSSFHGILPDEITVHIDKEFEGCRDYLAEKNIPHTSEADNFNIKSFCDAVCTYMHSKGFGRATDMAFYDFRNSLPHLFLTSSRRALPISLVYVFVAIVKRLGLQASALNTQGSVTALVCNTLVNVSRMLWEQGFTLGIVENYDDVKQIFSQPQQASLTAQLLARVGRNITIAGAVEFGNEDLDERYVGSDIYMWLQTKYLSQTLLSIFPEAPGDGNSGNIVPTINPTLFPLDTELVLQDKLFSFLPPYASMRHRDEDESNGEVAVDWSSSAQERPPELFVGQIVRSMDSAMLRCIVGWKRDGDDILCLTTACRHHKIKSNSLTEVKHILCSKVDIHGFLQNPILGQFFEDAEHQTLSEGSTSSVGRGRFIMNKRLMNLYPDDDIRGARWVRGEV